MSKYSESYFPPLVDTVLINSTGFLTNLQNFNDTIAGFLDLYSVASIYNAEKQLSDPVTHAATFFNQLNSGELPIKENERGVSTQNLVENGETSAPNNELVNEYINLIEQLPDTFGLDDLAEANTEFLVYWVEKYRISHDSVKKLLHSNNLLPKEVGGAYNTSNVYFNDFSESMYSLKTVSLYDPPRESLPIWDTKGTAIKELGGKHTIPNQFTGTQIYNVHHDVQELSFIMSRKTNTSFRNNMKNILDCVSLDKRIVDDKTSELTLKAVKITDSKQPHGGNLVPDSYHIARARQNAEPISRIITETLSNMSFVLNYMDKNLRNNKNTWGKFNALSMIEGTQKNVGLLHDKLNVVPHPTTIQSMLGS